MREIYTKDRKASHTREEGGNRHLVPNLVSTLRYCRAWLISLSNRKLSSTVLTLAQLATVSLETLESPDTCFIFDRIEIPESDSSQNHLISWRNSMRVNLLWSLVQRKTTHRLVLFQLLWSAIMLVHPNRLKHHWTGSKMTCHQCSSVKQTLAKNVSIFGNIEGFFDLLWS